MNLGKSYTIFEFMFWSRRLFYIALVCSSLPVILYQLLGLRWLSIPVAVVVLLGTATSFIVGFRNVQTYGRAVEAQQIWTDILSSSRCLGVMSRDFLAGRGSGRELILRHLAWLTALRYQLRTPTIWEDVGKAASVEYRKYYRVPEWDTPLNEALARYMPQAELGSLAQATCKTSCLLGTQAATIKRLLDAGEINNAFYMELLTNVRGLFALQGRAERIKNYPYPRQYEVTNRLFVRAFCLLLPFGMLTEFERLSASVSGLMHDKLVWLFIPFSAMISWIYLALEEIGQSTENPFAGNPNSVPMTQICRNIERELMDMFGEKSDVAEPTAEHGIVL